MRVVFLAGNIKDSSIVIKVIGRVVVYERYFRCKKQKQKHLSNIHSNISTSRKASKQHSTKYF